VDRLPGERATVDRLELLPQLGDHVTHPAAKVRVGRDAVDLGQEVVDAVEGEVPVHQGEPDGCPGLQGVQQRKRLVGVGPGGGQVRLLLAQVLDVGQRHEPRRHRRGA
jgi:hypothetical protein